jgi:putative transcriptional regulator
MTRVFPDGSTEPYAEASDWARVREMTEEEIMAAALSDPDNPPLEADSGRRWRRVPRSRSLRRALDLSRQEFAARYHIPLETLRDWEQGRSEPDPAARAYLEVIAGDPEGVARTLAAWDARVEPAEAV